MEYRTLDVTVVSAEDLKAPSFGKLQPYAVVWLDRHNRRTTRVDRNGRRNPSWNERLSFAVPEHLLQHPGSSLHVEIHNKGALVGRSLGTAVIPLPELVQQSEGNQVSMYQLRKRSGKAKGAVRLSVHVGEKTAAPPVGGYGGASHPVMAYPFNGQKMGHGGYPQGYPSQMPYQPYPQQGYYPPQQGYYQQPHGRRPGRMGGGMAMPLAAGALGGLLVGDMIGDAFDNDYGGGYDGGGFDGGGFDGGGFDGGF